MPFEAMSAAADEDLLAEYAAGDANAARALTQRLAPRVFSHAMRMLGGDRAEAEDVAQEALLRLWRAAPAWRTGEAKVSTWLYRVTANLCIDRIRRRRTGPDLDAVPEPVDEAPSAAAGMQQQARAEALQGALDSLPDRQRQAVILRHIEGLSNPEIAEIMDIGPRAVESLVARGKRALEAALIGRRAELGYEDDD
ncbi:RNA polymerase sigma factor [Mameliella sediminis]|uniref:RNA polymerase sigma factor n=1 Tax=Mameliella sediminis TaxID=2836866 RepID=UPI001C48BA1F|nr:RNA polymerase sigma factor [Mameliella sediminis]MBY6112848.1 RNA polymerase sigma factor [Antarctobacter heliothermus]MBY6143804.1 RNA polymerase sigma factor [Mameliella alba]MBV7394130.1 RNA polymerase sigma factor [Mameliella sediminis]MBY6162458.1 RNA polymerase sigma factor [Mameliella alba]MBY6170932.1 RNA polymerase sigma factor [Mameliella alba]